MEIRMVGSIPELMEHLGFKGTVDYLIKVVKDDSLLPAVLNIEAQATWMRLWMTKPAIRDASLSESDEKKLWENFKMMQKAQQMMGGQDVD